MGYEPIDGWPLFGSDQPVLSSDRQLVADLLNAARADSRLDDFDYSARMSRVYTARTFDDLVPLTRDLMA